MDVMTIARNSQSAGSAHQHVTFAVSSVRHQSLTWAEEVGGPGGACPPPIPLGATHVIGPSWKMLNQPPVSPLTLAMTENY